MSKSFDGKSLDDLLESEKKQKKSEKRSKRSSRDSEDRRSSTHEESRSKPNKHKPVSMEVSGNVLKSILKAAGRSNLIHDFPSINIKISVKP